MSFKTAFRALLATAMCFAAAATASAQSIVARGAGVYVGNNQNTRIFSLCVRELPNGSAQGYSFGYEPSTNSYVLVQVTSLFRVNGAVVYAGPIVATENAPPEYVVGAQTFQAVVDNGNGWGPTPDGITGTSVVPAFLGNLTAEQIIALIGPPPPVAFLPLLAGNIRVF